MKVLIACEESQTVCKAFRERGFEAYSCDIQNCSGGHPEWHICEDVLPILNGNCKFSTIDGTEHSILGNWDLIIAHPPCTHLAVSGAMWFENKIKDGRQEQAILFFMKFLHSNCKRVAVENPVGIISGTYVSRHFPQLSFDYGLPRKPQQVIQPWMFGDNCVKTTCLWLKGLPLLVPSVIEQPQMEYKEWINKKTGKKGRQSLWYYEAFKLPPEERARVRSKTFDGIAKAMAEQWGNYILKESDDGNNC